MFFLSEPGAVSPFEVTAHPLLRDGSEWEDKVYDQLDTVGMMVAGLRGENWKADSKEKAKSMTDRSMQLSFRLLHELDHFNGMSLHAREEDIKTEKRSLAFFQADSFLEEDPALNRMLDHLSVEEAIIKEAKDRISRVLTDAKSDLKVLSDEEFWFSN